jgi:hypothetical protein
VVLAALGVVLARSIAAARVVGEYVAVSGHQGSGAE